MKFSEHWLREWVNPPISRAELVEQLTLTGLEVDSLVPVAPDFSNVVVGEVLRVTQHPDADRLRVCEVNIGAEEPLSIVCGAQNVREGLKVAVAKIDAVLPGDFKIKKAKLRGVESFGMICSENELGLPETSPGIMELPLDAPIGKDIRDYLKLNDATIDIDLTPNRGDCLSIQGIAREVAAINKLPLTPPLHSVEKLIINPTLTLPVKNLAPDACTHYLGRVITRINAQVTTPLWMVEKLHRSDIRSISPIVDITNFVLLELGQPLHGFDLDEVSKGIEIRYAKENEKIDLLDEQKLSLSSKDLVITSADRPVALAGIKGGIDSGITSQTQNIFLESALFDPAVISKTSRKFGIITDSSYRYERGVDYNLQRQAIDRATQLIMEIAGGECGEIIEIGKPLKESAVIPVRAERIARVLGIELSHEEVEDLLARLNIKARAIQNGWEVIPPSYRYDLTSEIDIIEELARLYGYSNIPIRPLIAPLRFLEVAETQLDISQLKHLLMARGYQEAITYSFVDPKIEEILCLQHDPVKILNPIASDLAIMRTSLWSGLIKSYQYNYFRQQSRIRLFEVGFCFIKHEASYKQSLHLGGLCAGLAYKEQWGESKRAIDFYDVKADIEAILSQLYSKQMLRFEPYEHKALHPGKTAAIFCGSQLIGYLGAIHPRVAQDLDVNQPLYLFDINLESIMEMPLPTYKAISKFPVIRRDIALVVTTNVLAERIREKILDSREELLKNVQIFDVYQGKGIDPGKKSIALSLFFQHDSRTLVDAEINNFMQNIINTLHKEFNAVLRD